LVKDRSSPKKENPNTQHGSHNCRSQEVEVYIIAFAAKVQDYSGISGKPIEDILERESSKE